MKTAAQLVQAPIWNPRHPAISVCALLYGNYPDLAQRCLNSIYATGPSSVVADFRIAMHDVCFETRSFVTEWALRIRREWQKPVYLIVPTDNVFKYPTMRLLLWGNGRPGHTPISPLVMWFDDDSYLSTTNPSFWDNVLTPFIRDTGCAMIGQIWYWPLQGQQRRWLKTQPWYRKDLGQAERIRFCQGAWWVARTDVLHAANWPIPELRHCGGDSLLGEVLRQGHWTLAPFDTGVRINADKDGKHSWSRRRGHNERPIGAEYDGEPLPTDHHDFSCVTCEYQPFSGE